MNDINIITMGVINITPNSFSDGGRFISSTDLEILFKSLPIDSRFVWDIGAESTAPFNDPIGIEQEKQRLSLVLSLLELGQFKPSMLSLDTYRGEVATWFFEKALTLGFKGEQLIWNDVSGCWDDDVTDFLKSFPESTYIYSHSLAPKRELTSDHMKYISSQDIVDQVVSFFQRCDHPRVWLDPCFGFSKNYDQNWELIRRWDEVLARLGERDWVIGLSKKSFLRQYLQEQLGRTLPKVEALIKSEWVHVDLIRHFMALATKFECKKPLVFRVHDPDVVKLAASFN